MAAEEIMLAMNSEALSLGSKRYFIRCATATQIEGDAILCTDVLTGVTTLTEIISIPSVQVHDTAVTRPLRLALGSATSD